MDFADALKNYSGEDDRDILESTLNDVGVVPPMTTSRNSGCGPIASASKSAWCRSGSSAARTAFRRVHQGRHPEGRAMALSHRRRADNATRADLQSAYVDREGERYGGARDDLAAGREEQAPLQGAPSAQHQPGGHYEEGAVDDIETFQAQNPGGPTAPSRVKSGFLGGKRIKVATRSDLAERSVQAVGRRARPGVDLAGPNATPRLGEQRSHNFGLRQVRSSPRSGAA